MRAFFSVVFLVALGFAGCQTASMETQFDASAHEFALGAGDASVFGQAFMRRNDGVVVYAAGSTVLLMPDTGYTREIVEKSQIAFGGFSAEAIDKRYEKYTKETVADGEGRFTFASVPAGNYYLVTYVTWYAGGIQQGGRIYRQITVEDGAEKSIIMTS
ncbi:hypothetical protein [Rhodobium gokarnense]|uniref:Carboxypeptidase regulatory-like domain-containing protein n=1 Tax=Rhodobium gokarnense TaxID=364296 RepID=A0ABT3HH69_9HYPH|nr:hypothetical protein [Rhodobium gokarnense]MCW2309741.1 hypothetical protein [Rhodobium gokarnense]